MGSFEYTRFFSYTYHTNADIGTERNSKHINVRKPLEINTLSYLNVFYCIPFVLAERHIRYLAMEHSRSERQHRNGRQSEGSTNITGTD